jgi:uncharacterized protein DUF4136
MMSPGRVLALHADETVDREWITVGTREGPMTMCRLFIGFALAAVLPAAAAAQDVTYDYNPSRDFAALKTYSFTPPATSETTTELTSVYDSQFVTERTHAAIAAQLDRRGLTRDDKHPDVYVKTQRTFRKEIVAYPFVGYPYGWGSGYYGPSFYYGWDLGGWYAEEKIKGTLTIDMTDADTGELLWRGLGERKVHPTSKPERRAKRINKEVAEIFKKFPVGSPLDE